MNYEKSEEESREDRLKKLVDRLGSVHGMKACLEAARSEAEVATTHERLNQHPWLLNVENGTLDLRTGELKPHRHEDLLTTLAPVTFDPAADCPRWLAFVDEIMCGDQSRVQYLQRAVGMSLTGVVRDHVLLFCYGKGANGKSTFLNTIGTLLGPDYALKAPPGLLMVKTRDEHPTGYASLFGKRFAACIEAEEGARLSETMVKELTGGDPVTARRMREDYWTFNPTHKLWIAANHRPEIRGTDDGIWRRVRLIPFEASIPEERQDRQLPEALAGELSGILNWALMGCLEWQRDGLVTPTAVEMATMGYRADMDVMGCFLEERCHIGPDARVAAQALYNDYKSWCEANGDMPINQRRFGRQLNERGFERYTSNGTWYRGVMLK